MLHCTYKLSCLQAKAAADVESCFNIYSCLTLLQNSTSVLKIASRFFYKSNSKLLTRYKNAAAFQLDRKNVSNLLTSLVEMSSSLVNVPVRRSVDELDVFEGNMFVSSFFRPSWAIWVSLKYTTRFTATSLLTK